MKVVPSETCVKIPSDDSAVNSTSENERFCKVKSAAHDVLFVHLGRLCCRKVFATDRIFFLTIVSSVVVVGRVEPDVELFIPAHREEAWSFDLLLLFIRIMNTDQCCDLSVYFLLLIRNEQLYKLLSIWEVPDFDSTICLRSDQSTAFHVEGSRGNLGVEWLWQFWVHIVLRLKFRHHLTVLNVPNLDEASIVTRDYRVEMVVITSEGNWRLVTSFYFFLCFERPKFDNDRADYYVVGDRVVSQGTQDILRAISDSINNGLNALVVSCVPNLDHLIGSKTDQVVALFVDVKVRYWSIVSV